jgi:hypothetical protein
MARLRQAIADGRQPRVRVPGSQSPVATSGAAVRAGDPARDDADFVIVPINVGAVSDELGFSRLSCHRSGGVGWPHRPPGPVRGPRRRRPQPRASARRLRRNGTSRPLSRLLPPRRRRGEVGQAQRGDLHQQRRRHRRRPGHRGRSAATLRTHRDRSDPSSATRHRTDRHPGQPAWPWPGREPPARDRLTASRRWARQVMSGHQGLTSGPRHARRRSTPRKTPTTPTTVDAEPIVTPDAD